MYSPRNARLWASSLARNVCLLGASPMLGRESANSNGTVKKGKMAVLGSEGHFNHQVVI